MSKLFRAVILGAPGSGKGTISSRVVRKFDMKHISSGDILRTHVATGTPLGLQAKRYMDSGQLVPDEVLIGAMLKAINRARDANWLLDGFPRTRGQAEKLLAKTPINVALNLVVPFEVIVNRLGKRWIHQPSGRVYNLDFNAPKNPGLDDITGDKLVQRKDDEPAAVKKRLEVYTKTLGPVVEFYRSKGILKDFKGNTSDEIWPQVFEFLSSHIKPVTPDSAV